MQVSLAEGFAEPSLGEASGAKQNLDSLSYATEGCSVEDPKGPLTRISERNPTTNEDKNLG